MTLATLYDRMDNARIEYADMNGGDNDPDWLGATDACDIGMVIGREALAIKDAEEREYFIEAEIGKHDMSAQYVISCAARYEIACGEGV